MSRTMQFNSLTDIHKALSQDIITTDQAIIICCNALQMIDFRFKDDPLSKEQVLSQIINLDHLLTNGCEHPIFFGQKDNVFNIKDICIGSETT
jgi:hypothetical protein